MGNCATCKWWDKDTHNIEWEAGYWNNGRPGWGRCLLTANRFDWKRAEELGFEDTVSVYPETLAYAVDVEFYAADLRTHETFGCVQYEAKPDDEA